MPRATHVRGQPVRNVAGQRQAIHRSQVQAAALPALVDAEVNEVAESLGTSISAINDTLLAVDSRLDALESA